MIDWCFLLERAEKPCLGVMNSCFPGCVFSADGNGLERRYFHCRLHDSQNPVYPRGTGYEVCIHRLIDTEISITNAVMISTSFKDSAPKEFGVASIEEKVIGIVSEQLNVAKEDIKAGSDFVADLKADSLDLVELVMEFEDEFGVQIPEADQSKIKTVGDAVKYITEKQ